MLYCASCEVLSTDGETCPMCGGKKLRPVEQGDPVLLMTTGAEESRRICDAFKDDGIPCEALPLGTGGIMQIYTGTIAQGASVRIFVPYRAVERCRQILAEYGILDGTLEKAGPESPDEPGGKPRHRVRHAAVQICSALALLALIWLTVTFADTLVNFAKSLFAH